MLGNFLQMLYNLADSYFPGKVGKEALSAPSISMNLIFFLIIFACGFYCVRTCEHLDRYVCFQSFSSSGKPDTAQPWEMDV